MSSNTIQTRQPGWWYPYIFVAGFGVVLLVNGALAYFATSTFTGLSTERPYEKGLAYNQNIAMAKAQADMGWKVETKVRPQSDGATNRFEVVVSYRDKTGAAVDGMDVRARVIRPTLQGYDHEIELKSLGLGLYGGTYPLPLNGVWDMDIVAMGQGVAYEHAQRFVIP